MVSSSGCAANKRIRSEGSERVVCSRHESRFQYCCRSACKFMLFRLIGKNAQCLAISIQRAHVYINIAPLHANCRATIREIGIDQRSQVFVDAPAIKPEAMKLSKVFTCKLERSPYPL